MRGSYLERTATTRYRGYVQYIMGLDRSVELGVFFWMKGVGRECGVGGGGWSAQRDGEDF